MLSSLKACLKALRQLLAERLGLATHRTLAANPPAPPAPSRTACDDPLCGVLELSYPREDEKHLQTQSVWIRVDTRKLMQRLCENPDIDLDALQGTPRAKPATETPALSPPLPCSEPAQSDWHEKVRLVTQAPPAAKRVGRRPPPPTHH